VRSPSKVAVKWPDIGLVAPTLLPTPATASTVVTVASWPSTRFCPSTIRIVTVTPTAIHLLARSGNVRGVISSGLTALAPVAAPGTDVWPLFTVGATVKTALVVVTLASLGFSARLLP
jgi:hypothetical protein